VQLSDTEARIAGCLIEKQLATPQQYPLTVNALVAACNQASNRDPVMALTDDEVLRGLDDLKTAHLVRFVLPSHGRSAVRYRHVFDEALALSPEELALVSVLLLRGPQTVGELRTRTERLAAFATLADTERVLGALGSRTEPLVARLGRRPGQKEDRWTDLLAEPRVAPSEEAPLGTDEPSEPASSLAEELAALRAEVEVLRGELDELRANLGG
jgi:uncharacterized protein